MSRARAFAGAVCLALLPGIRQASAHPGPHHEIERLTGLLRAEPNRPDLLVQRAVQYRLDGQLEKALQDVDRARTIEPAAPDIALQRGLILSALRADAEADRELTRALQVPSPPAAAYAERAAVRQRLGRATEALADYNSAIALKPEIEAYCARGRLLESLGRQDEAAAGFRDGMDRLGGPVVLRKELIRLAVARGRWAEALRLVDEELPQTPIKTEWLLQRAEIQQAAGNAPAARFDREAALHEAQRAFARRPTALNQYWKARALVSLDRSDDAIMELINALARSPRFALAADLLAQLEARRAKPAPRAGHGE
jgi:tetratricopeptide (TPR) repeat protein